MDKPITSSIRKLHNKMTGKVSTANTISDAIDDITKDISGGKLKLYATGTYVENAWEFIFDKAIEAGKTYVIVFESSLVTGATTEFTMPISILFDDVSFGPTMTISPSDEIGIVEIVPRFITTKGTKRLKFDAWIVYSPNGDTTGSNIYQQLMPTITSLKLYTLL